MDLTTLTDDELDQQRIDVATEQERRQSLATVPPAIAGMARQYLDDGGEQSALQDAITPAD